MRATYPSETTITHPQFLIIRLSRILELRIFYLFDLPRIKKSPSPRHTNTQKSLVETLAFFSQYSNINAEN